MGNHVRQWHGSDTAMFGLRAFWYMIIFIYTILYPIATKPIILQLLWVSLAFLIPQLFWRPGCMRPNLFLVTDLVFMGSFELWTIFVLQQTDTSIYISALMAGYISQSYSRLWAGPIFILFEFIGAAFGVVGVGDVVNISLFSLALFAIGYGIKRLVEGQQRLKQLMDVIEEKNVALTQYAQQVEQITLLEERNRMARELHDSIGHSLVTVVLGIDVAISLIDQQPKIVKDRLVELREYTGKALDEIRNNIHHIVPQTEEVLLSISLKQLATEFSTHTGKMIDFAVHGDEYRLPLQKRLVLLRCLQESLTNAVRHGRADSIKVELYFVDTEIQLKVTDNGMGIGKIEYGFGLQAMKDRVSILQGSLMVESNPRQGTVVLCTLPRKEV